MTLSCKKEFRLQSLSAGRGHEVPATKRAVIVLEQSPPMTALSVMHLIGFEPTIFGFGSHCIIHYATDAHRLLPVYRPSADRQMLLYMIFHKM